ncbi:hypothetical protein VTJ04DRAFT_8757 [Mycothermus thermophilus]|uniref:uncharacterized protein n=1 Tax=Humicola insolens TaxID=85995 RepID=UPI0037422B90
MDDHTQNAVRHGHHARTSRVPADGVVGRLTYTPAVAGQPIGQIKRNRAKNETPRFKQVTPFEQWCPPTKTPTPPNDMGPWQVSRSQKNWLLEYLPEASFMDDELNSLLMEEIAASQAERGAAPDETAPLCSVGEVVDLRQRKKGHPVLAVTSGISGNSLRLISLAQEEWIWNEADIRVRLHVPELDISGEWSRDAVPISLIKFVVDLRLPDGIRWLVVSNGASTTVYEPELRMIPMPTASKVHGPGSPAASQFYPNPLFTIPCERTGPAMQSDVCLVRHHEKEHPTLVIVDKTGCWSLWDIMGRRNVRPQKLTPVLRMCGTSIAGCIPKLPPAPTTEPEQYKVFWLMFTPPPSPNRPEKKKKKKRSSGTDLVVAQQPRRLLLLCSPKALRLFDTESQKLHLVSQALLPRDNLRILGAAPSRLDPSQAFVLTSTNLFWVAVREGKKKDQLTLDVLASCPHHRNVNDPTLRMDVSPGAYIRGHKACFVSVRSTRDTEIVIFWFIQPEQGQPVRYHREIISLKSPANFVGLHILPAGRMRGNEPTSPAGKVLNKAGLRFFQVLTISQDLAVHGALCAWSDEPEVVVPPPDAKERMREKSKWRQRLLQMLTDAFAVPDGFDERAVFGKHGLGLAAVERLDAGRQQFVDLSLVAQRLSEAVGLDVEDEGWSGSQKGVDLDFLAKAVERRKEDGYMRRHSLLDLAADHPKSQLFEMARAWDVQQDMMHRNATDWSFVPEPRRPMVDFGPEDLLDKLRDLFLGSQPEHHPQPSRDKILRIMAAEMFLSTIGLAAFPQSWTASTEPDEQGSLPFPASPSIMPSSQISPAIIKGKDKLIKPELDQDQPALGDLSVLRLRKYATITRPSPDTIQGETVVGLSRWDLGADPDDITWRPGQDLEAEDAINRRRRKWEARRRKAERLSQRIFGEDSFGGAGSSIGGGGGFASSSQSFGFPVPVPGSSQQQQVPTILPTSSIQTPRGAGLRLLSPTRSQQLPPWEFASQPQSQQQAFGFGIGIGTPRVRAPSPLRREYRRDSSQLVQESRSQSQDTPSKPKSQVLPGVFGGRPSFSPFKRSGSPLKGKGKRKSEVRVSGFR